MKAGTSVWRTTWSVIGNFIRDCMLLAISVIIVVVFIIPNNFSPKSIKATFNRYRLNNGRYSWDSITRMIDKFIKIEISIRTLVFESIDASYKSYEPFKDPSVTQLENIKNYYKENSK